jgi:transcription termination factor Rho
MTTTDDTQAALRDASDPARRSGAELLALLRAEGAAVTPNLSRGELLAALYAHRLGRGQPCLADGVLELLPEGFGFLRSAGFDFAAGPHDAFVSPSQVRALNLKPGHRVRGPLRAPRGNERFFALLRVDAVNGIDPAALPALLSFAARTPVVGSRPLRPAGGDPAFDALAALAPWCFGQRILWTAPPDWPLCPLLPRLLAALRAQAPALRTFVGLLEQRPEDLAAMRAACGAIAGCEVVGTTFDEPPARSVALAELLLAAAQREVEAGHDVLLLLDSLSALTAAAQRAEPASGRWLCPGLDAQAVLPARRLFAAARQCAEGGSLSVLALLRDGGSPVDAALRAEFGNRGNSEVVVDAARLQAGAEVPFAPAATRTRPEDDVRPAAERAAAQELRARLSRR